MAQTLANAKTTTADFQLAHKVRFVTAASLFDGHDAAIHIMRRILQSQGAEVIHLGHNRSVKTVVDAAIQEDVQGIAVSSYQGGHVEYFSYMLEMLRDRRAEHIRVYGGGGGVIVPDEIELLHKRGVARIFSPADGATMGLVEMIRHMLRECDHPAGAPLGRIGKDYGFQQPGMVARAITTIEAAHADSGDAADDLVNGIRVRLANMTRCPVVGFTGTGGAGKSSLVDEVLTRFLETFDDKRVAVLSVDPSRRRTGGALLGDRIRLNSAERSDRVFVRSLATRRANLATSAAVKDSLDALVAANFDLVILETAGIGQSDSEVTELVDLSVYVMTPEYGAASQLEKIDMLDFADMVVINKFDKQGAADAMRDVQKACQRNHNAFDTPVEEMPVFGTTAHRFDDLGTNTFFNALMANVAERSETPSTWQFDALAEGDATVDRLIPSRRTRYLGEIADSVRGYHTDTDTEADLAYRADGVWRCLADLGDDIPTAGESYVDDRLDEEIIDAAVLSLRRRYNDLLSQLSDDARATLRDREQLANQYEQPEQTYKVRGNEVVVENFSESLSGQAIPKVCLPSTNDWASWVKFARSENLPGRFPFTAGVFEFKRQNEDPTRMFAGEGAAERTNRRFHLVSREQPAVRLSTAFDSVTLYGADPAKRPDIYGKVGNAGVSVCSLDDAKRLYSGFDLCKPSTSVSMTINGPAPTVLAFFFNAAIDAACERHLREQGRWEAVEQSVSEWFASRNLPRPVYRADELPAGHDGSGLGFLGLPADMFVERDEYEAIKTSVLQCIRGTVQADILKEDQAQNTCIFSTEFAMRMMGDVQQYFVDHNVRNFYSVSISGYHIAEAGANPITQLALTLSNGFTLVEYYRARGMDVSQFAPNLSFFFSNGMDAEYSVIGRVARRIWAIAMRDVYGADERSQKLKYHIQTSGRSLHAREIAFNDIRTTLQAFYAIADNCNSLHTNAYDEAITTPTEESVRRAIAIQLIINRELGLAKNENPLQGSYFVERLTDMVEAAVLNIFDEIDRRGGTLGAMETMYQRSRIQEESLRYEELKNSGELPLVGINTFIDDHADPTQQRTELIRSTTDEKDDQVAQVAELADRFADRRDESLKRLKQVATSGGNVFAELMETTKYCSLGSITNALYGVGGAYRRSM